MTSGRAVLAGVVSWRLDGVAGIAALPVGVWREVRAVVVQEGEIAEAFNRVGAAYARAGGPLINAPAEDLVERLELSAGMRFVDVGCGPGTVLSYAEAAMGSGEAVGIDLSRVQIEEARERFRRSALRPRFLQESAIASSLPDGWADAVGLGLVLPYAETPVQMLREAVRIAKVGGRVGATVWGRPFFGRPGGRLLDVLHRRGIPLPEVQIEYEHRTLAELAFFCNLRQVEIAEFERELWFDDFDAWWRALYVCGLLPGLEGSDLSELGDMLREDAGIVDEDGQVRTHVRVWLLVAVVDR